MVGRTPVADKSVVSIANRIRAYRILADLTQEQVGEALGVSGVQVQKYELGKSRVSAERLIDLARALNVSVLDLLGVCDTNAVDELLEIITESGAGSLLRHYKRIKSPIDRVRLVDRAYILANTGAYNAE